MIGADRFSAAPEGGRQAGRTDGKKLHQRWNEEIGHGQGQYQIDDNDPYEIRQVRTGILRKEQDHQQGSHRRCRSCEDGRENLLVFPIPIVVSHDNGRVDHDTQGYGDAGKRIDMNLQTSKGINSDGGQDVDSQGGRDDEEITPGTADQEHEQQEDEDAKAGPEKDFPEFPVYIIRRIISNLR